MKVHALVDDRERSFAEGALKNAELWREMEELQSACAEDAAQGARPAQLVQSARGAYVEHLANTARVGQQWQAEAALIDAECESELGRLRSFDDDLVDQSARSVEAGLANSAMDQVNQYNQSPSRARRRAHRPRPPLPHKPGLLRHRSAEAGMSERRRTRCRWTLRVPDLLIRSCRRTCAP